jgi:ribosomal-protein-alanine N-acetyltransferase
MTPLPSPRAERGATRHLTQLGSECEFVIRTYVVSRLFYEADRGPRPAAQPENRPRRDLVAPVCLSTYCSRVPPETIETERLDLVLLGADFVAALLEGRRSDAENHGGFTLPDDWPDEHDSRFLAFRLRQMREKPNETRWLVRAVVLRKPDRLMIGHAGFHGPPGHNARKDAQAVEVGYTIFPDYRRQGYAIEAVRALIGWAGEQGVTRFVASIAPDNTASLALVRRLGFREAGTTRTETSSSSSSATAPEGTLDLSLRVSLGDVAALVDRLLAAREGELDLRAAVLPVHPRRNERQPTLARLSDQRRDLAAVQEQLPVTLWIVIGDVPLVVRGDVRADKPDLASTDVPERLPERRPPLTQGLHLRSSQHEPCLEPLEQLVVVARATVVDDQLLSGHTPISLGTR